MPDATTERPAGERSVLVLLTVPQSMVGDDLPTLERKLSANAGVLIPFLAGELHRNLGQPDASPELLLARVVAETRAQERSERAATDEASNG